MVCFVNNAASIFTTSGLDQFKIFGSMMIPGMAKMMRLMGTNTFKPKQTMFFVNIVKKTIQQRKATKERKGDLIDLMLDAMEGLKEEEEEENEDQYEADMKMTHKANGKDIDEMGFIGTAMVFLVAGYDTTGMTLSWICYELAKNPDLQRRWRENSGLQRHPRIHISRPVDPRVTQTSHSDHSPESGYKPRIHSPWDQHQDEEGQHGVHQLSGDPQRPKVLSQPHSFQP